MAAKQRLTLIAIALVIGAAAWLCIGRHLKRSGAFEAAFPSGARAEFLIRFDHLEDPPDPTSLCFNLDNEGRPFLLAGDTFIRLPRLDEKDPDPIEVAGLGSPDHFAWMPGGALLLVRGAALGQLTKDGFERIQALPATGMKVEPASRGQCYLYGGDTADQARNVYIYRRGGERLHLLHTGAAVGAVRGNGGMTYVAIGDAAYVLAPGKEMALVFRAPAPIKSLALGPEGSFFFATENEAGYVDSSGRGFIFLRGRGPRLCRHGEDLFLFFPDMGVMQCTPASAFQQASRDVSNYVGRSAAE